MAALLYAAALLAREQSQYVRPGLAWAVLAVLAVWTVVTLRRPPVTLPAALVDLAVASAAILATLLVDDPARIAAGEQTLPAVWPAAAVLAWAVRDGRRGGLIAAAVITVVDLLEVRRLSATTVNNIVLLIMVGLVVGYGVELFRTGRRELARAVALEAATRERERLAADIHDSVLQVLSFVQRRAGELDASAGGSAEAAALARLAGEQEVRLRALVATGSGPAAGSGPGAASVSVAGSATASGSVLDASGDAQLVDVQRSLAGVAGRTTSFAGPGHPVLLEPGRAAALLGAVRAALDNVEQHAGDGARAWLLLEEEAGAVTVTVRDDGVGMPPGRPEEAAAQGRLGLSASIRARMADVGGGALVSSEPGRGTEIELRLPAPGSSPTASSTPRHPLPPTPPSSGAKGEPSSSGAKEPPPTGAEKRRRGE